MNEKAITQISIDSFLALNALQEGDIYYEGCLMTKWNLTSDTEHLLLFRHPIRIDAAIVILCTEGTIDLISDMERYHIAAHTLFIQRPGSITQIEAIDNAVGYAALLPMNFIQQIDIDLKRFSQILLQAANNPLLHLNDEEWHDLTDAFQEISNEYRKQRTDEYSQEILRSIVRTAVYKTFRTVHDCTEHLGQQPKVSSRNRNEEYFRRFIALLSEYYVEQRSVGFYADKLHLTPKYLTTIIRCVSDRTATDWIDDHVILEAKNLLKYSTMSVQEVAYALNFPNQSFFGRYFKNHTGLTPSAYRVDK